METSVVSAFGTSKLGNCEVCAINESKYTCPKCEIKTCCLECLKIHKKELSCDGVRDRTKFIPLKQMTELSFQNDYKFLEECTRYVGDRKVDRIKTFTRYNKQLPAALMKFRTAAKNRDIAVRFMVDNFTKRKENTSFHNHKDQQIYWRVEWIFPNAGNLKFVDAKCAENEALQNLLAKYLNPDCLELSVALKKPLEFYQSKGLGHLRVLLKAEGVKNCKNRFYELDVDKSLLENLKKKTIVEFPSIYIIFEESTGQFDIIDSEMDIHLETVNYKKELDILDRENKLKKIQSGHVENAPEPKISEPKKKPIDKNVAQNFLFTDEAMLNDESSEDEIEEDIIQTSASS